MAESLVGGRPRIYRKSILIEFRLDDSIVESFILPVPPESIEINQGMRKTITQTFDSAIIDNLGLALGKITIKGHTGDLRELRETIGGPNKIKIGPFNSAEAAEQILRRIVQYPIATNTKDNFEKLECRFYDLSQYVEHKEDDFNFDKSKSAPPPGYIVSLDNYSVSRNSDKYGYYQYSLEATILEYLGKYRKPKLETRYKIVPKPNPQKTKKLLEEYNETMAKVVKGIEKTRSEILGVVGFTNKVVNDIFQPLNDIGNAVDDIISVNNTFISIIDDSIDQTLYLSRLPVKIVKTFIKTCRNLAHALGEVPYKLSKEMVDIAEEYAEIDDLIEETFNSSIKFFDNQKKLLEELYTQTIPRILGTPIKMPTEEKDEETTETETEASEITIYGYKTLQKTPETTPARLASQYLNDPTKIVAILLTNNVSDWDSIPVGSTIKVPIINPIIQNQNNIVLDNNPLGVLGTDLKRDENGNLKADKQGNLKLVSGTENLSQAVLNRLDHTVGADVRRQAYGIQINIGDEQGSEAAQGYVMNSILDTLRQEPRIKEVNSIDFSLDGNTIIINVDITSIAGQNIVINKVA